MSICYSGAADNRELMDDAYQRRVNKMFEIKDSGKRQEFKGGMVRDTEDNKVDYDRVANGPMLLRWAQHLTKAAREKYKDASPGVPNWTLAKGDEELYRFKRSAFRHFIQWFLGKRDEDHASAVFFNINGYEKMMEDRNTQSDTPEEFHSLDRPLHKLAEDVRRGLEGLEVNNK